MKKAEIMMIKDCILIVVGFNKSENSIIRYCGIGLCWDIIDYLLIDWDVAEIEIVIKEVVLISSTINVEF